LKNKPTKNANEKIAIKKLKYFKKEEEYLLLIVIIEAISQIIKDNS
jgi:hypothetical protein